MIFTVRDLGFEIGPFLLEGWWALAARAVCAAVIVFAGLLVGWLLRRKIFPALQARSWHFAATPILLRSLQSPLERMAFYSGLYLALTSLPWAIPGLTKFLFTAYKIAATLLLCQGLYNASEVADLLLASCSLEIRSNKTLRSLLDTTYKVLVIILGVATCAQIVGFPIGSIVAGAGLVGLTISLAAQESASNLFSGIVILLDKPFSIGDWISVGEVEGEVVDINFRSTKVRALDNSVYILTNSTVSSADINFRSTRIRSMDHSVVIITNSQICASTVQNTALRTMRPYKFTLGVTYGTTRAQLEKLMADLQAMLDNSPYTNKGTNIVRLTSFGDSSINILISAYLTTNVYATFLQQQNDLNLNIMDVMQADGVDFAFPSTSVYIEKN